MRKILFLISATLIVIITVILFLLFGMSDLPKSNTIPQITPFPTITGTQLPQGDRLEISNIEVDNFYSDAERIDNQKNVYIVDDRQRYQIIYEERFNQFLISIIESPFEEIRLEAEQKLIAELGIIQADACFLSVSITTPAFANPDFSGKAYGLSFCE